MTDDIFKRLTKARDEGEQWFKIELTIPYEDDEEETVKAITENMEKLMVEGMELMAAEKMADLPADAGEPSIILPN